MQTCFISYLMYISQALPVQPHDTSILPPNTSSFQSTRSFEDDFERPTAVRVIISTDPASLHDEAKVDFSYRVPTESISKRSAELPMVNTIIDLSLTYISRSTKSPSSVTLSSRS